MARHVVHKSESLFALMEAKTPGSKVNGPSRESAVKVQSRANTLRRLAHEALCRTPLTAHELAEFLGESTYAVSPRISELREEGLVIDSGMRRINDSGHKATVWKGVDPSVSSHQ